MSDPNQVSERQKLHEIELEAFKHLGSAIKLLNQEVKDLKDRIAKLEEGLDE